MSEASSTTERASAPRRDDTDSAVLVVGHAESRQRRRLALAIGLVFGAGQLISALTVGGWFLVFVATATLVVGALAVVHGDVRSHVVFRPVEAGYLEATLVVERRALRDEHVVRCAPADVEVRRFGFAWMVVLRRRWVAVQTLSRRRAEAHAQSIRALSVLGADEVAPEPERRARFDVGSARGLRLLVGGVVGLPLCLTLASLLPRVSLLFMVLIIVGMLVGAATFEWVEVEILPSEDDRMRVSHRRRWPGTEPPSWVVREARSFRWIRGRLVLWLVVDDEPVGWCLHRAQVERDLARLGIATDGRET